MYLYISAHCKYISQNNVFVYLSTIYTKIHKFAQFCTNLHNFKYIDNCTVLIDLMFLQPIRLRDSTFFHDDTEMFKKNCINRETFF